MDRYPQEKPEESGFENLLEENQKQASPGGNQLPEAAGEGRYLHRQLLPTPASGPAGGPPPDVPRKAKRRLFWPVLLAVLLTASLTFVLTAAAGYIFYADAIRGKSSGGVVPEGQTLTFTDEEGLGEALDKFSTVYNLLQENYYQEFNDAEMVEKMTEGLINEMGSPYTFYLTPEYNKAVEDSMKGEYYGIGAVVMKDHDGNFVVSDIIPDSPAESVDLFVGDIFVKVDGQDALEFEDVGELAAAVRGDEGTLVKLVIYRPLEDRELSLTIRRAKVANAAVRFYFLDTGIGYIHLTEFSDHAAEHFENALVALMLKGAEHFVIDLRNNGGGYAQECINMLDVVLPPVTVATVKGREEGQVYEDEWKTKTASLTPDDTRYVILLNRYSASASELFAGALRDHGKAVIVGENSFGKGVGTMTWKLPDNSAVQITGFEYFLPKGESIDQVGLKPDYEIKLPDEVETKAPNRRTLEEDDQLQKALELLQPEVRRKK